MPRILRGLHREQILKLALVLSLVFVVGGSAYGSQIAFEFDSAPTVTDNPLSLGFQFTTGPNIPLVISSLGYYDDGGDGLLTSHQVGIFDASGTLLVSATVSAGTADPLIGHFRYASITPFTISSSRTFTIAATTGGPSDPWAYGLNTEPGFVVDPHITIAANAGRFVYRPDDALVYPTESFLYTFYAGPDFQFDAAVPEPGTFTLLGLVILPAAMLSRSSRFRRFAVQRR